MRTRVAKSLGLAAATVGLVVASLLPATPAFAVDAYVSTNTSGPGGIRICLGRAEQAGAHRDANGLRPR
jgi:uncharacterized membrane protein (GlpM family)